MGTSTRDCDYPRPSPLTKCHQQQYSSNTSSNTIIPYPLQMVQKWCSNMQKHAEMCGTPPGTHIVYMANCCSCMQGAYIGIDTSYHWFSFADILSPLIESSKNYFNLSHWNGLDHAQLQNSHKGYRTLFHMRPGKYNTTSK